MLTLYVVIAVILSVLYTVLKVVIQEWITDISMAKREDDDVSVTNRLTESSDSVPVVTYNLSSLSSCSTGPLYHSGNYDRAGALSKDLNPHIELNDNARSSFDTAPKRSPYDESTDSSSTETEVVESEGGLKNATKTSSSSSKRPLFTWQAKQLGKNAKVKMYHRRGIYSSEHDSSDDDDGRWTPKHPWMHSKKQNSKKAGMNYDDDVEIVNSFDRNEIEQEPPTALVAIQHEITIAGTKVKLPVKPYPCQIAVMNVLIQGCAKEQNCLLESPTGSGKTLALLCGVLAWREQYRDQIAMELARAGTETPSTLDDMEFRDGNNTKAADRWTKNAKQVEERSAKEVNFEDASDDEGKCRKVPKVYYGTRTHRQIAQVIRELKKTAYRNVKMTILSSREHTCIQNTNRNKTELCNELLDPATFKKCPYYSENNKKNISTYAALERHRFESPWDIEDLVKLGNDNGSCPYFAARNLMAEADIIFCPYNYLIDPDIRESMQINLAKEIVILDEAHNIEDICRDVASVSFREDHLEVSAVDCEALTKTRAADHDTYATIMLYLRGLNNFLRILALSSNDSFADQKSSQFWTGAELLELLEINKIGASVYEPFLIAGKAAIVDFNQAKEDVRLAMSGKPKPTISLFTKKVLERLTFALQMITSEKYVNDYRACVTEHTARDVSHITENTWHSSTAREQRVRTLKLLCMNPAVIFAPLANATRSIVLASGTLAPVNSFQSELGTRFPQMLSANHVISKDQVYVRCIPRGPSGTVLKANFQTVNSWAFQDELGRLLVEVCRSVPHGVLCFFSSYRVMRTQMERWKTSGCWDELVRVKRVFEEPNISTALAETMDDYRATIEDTSDGPVGSITGALLFAVFRGKVAEGIDFSDNEARCVLTIGIPYAVRNDPAVKMKYEYNDKNVSGGFLRGGEWYTVQAFRALNQALGRCLRHKDDWGAVLLVDERFLMQNNINYLPKWIKNMWLTNQKYNLRAELENFVKRQVEREKGQLAKK